MPRKKNAPQKNQACLRNGPERRRREEYRPERRQAKRRQAVRYVRCGAGNCGGRRSRYRPERYGRSGMAVAAAAIVAAAGARIGRSGGDYCRVGYCGVSQRNVGACWRGVGSTRARRKKNGLRTSRKPRKKKSEPPQMRRLRELGELCLQGVLRRHSRRAHALPLAEEYYSGNGMYAETLRQFGRLVHIHFANRGRVAHFVRKRVDRRREHLARAAPRRPKVDQNGFVERYNGVKIRRIEVLNFV